MTNYIDAAFKALAEHMSDPTGIARFSVLGTADYCDEAKVILVRDRGTTLVWYFKVLVSSKGSVVISSPEKICHAIAQCDLSYNDLASDVAKVVLLLSSNYQILSEEMQEILGPAVSIDEKGIRLFLEARFTTWATTPMYYRLTIDGSLHCAVEKIVPN